MIAVVLAAFLFAELGLIVLIATALIDWWRDR